MLKSTSNITYHVQEGQGTPIVFLHGLCEDHSIWDEFVQPFAERHIIRIDLPGFGASEVYGNGSLRAMAEAVNKVLQKERVSKSIMIGHSMGGYVALEYAKKQGAERMAGLGLFHSHPFEDSQERKDIRKKNIAHIDNYGTKAYIEHLFQNLTTPEFMVANKERMATLTEKALKTKAHGVVNALEAMRTRKDNTEILRDFNYPILFIVGLKDQTISPKLNLQQLHLPNLADIHILPNVAHLGMIEAKEQTQNIINHFVKLCELML
jgi:pimeloyl-ACP methyl ester carboxylesterase